MLEKVFLKAACKGEKEVKKFTLRNVDPTQITLSDDLKDFIETYFHGDMKSGDFNVGLYGRELR